MVHPSIDRKRLLDLRFSGVEVGTEEVEGVDTASAASEAGLLWA